MKKVAFLVLAHTNPEQVRMLIGALTSEHTDVYVHFDAKYKGDLSIIKENVIEKRNEVYHSGYSVVNSTIDLIRYAYNSGARYEYYMLLSGQCFPVRSVSWLCDVLTGEHDYINYYPMPREISAKTLDRLEYFHVEGDSVFTKASRRLLRCLPKRNFVKGMSMWPYSGSQWWCLREDTVRYILGFIDKYPAYSGYMRTTRIPDEVYFHSIISNMGIEHEIRPALFRAEFDPKTNRPYIVNKENINRLNREGIFILRKFDTKVDTEVIIDLMRRNMT